jgi:hypothetical protein
LKESPSYPPVRKVLSNLKFIKNNGIEKFLAQQNVRMNFLKIMMARFDNGRSRGYYCRVSALLKTTTLKSSIDEAMLKIKAEGIKHTDRKAKAKILRGILDGHLSKVGAG